MAYNPCTPTDPVVPAAARPSPHVTRAHEGFHHFFRHRRARTHHHAAAAGLAPAKACVRHGPLGAAPIAFLSNKAAIAVASFAGGAGAGAGAIGAWHAAAQPASIAHAAVAVPEPATYAVLLPAIALLAFVRVIWPALRSGPRSVPPG